MNKSNQEVYSSEESIYIVKKTMRRLDRFVLLKLNCLIRSCVFKCLLNKFGLESSLSLGVMFSEKKSIKAHAFVKINEKVIFQRQKGFLEVYNVI